MVSNPYPQVIAVVGAASNFGSLMLTHLETMLPDCQLVSIDTHPLLRPVKQVSSYRMEPNRTGAILTIDDIPEVLQSKAWDMVLDQRLLTMADVPDVFHLESVDTVVHIGSLYDRANMETFLSDTLHWIRACRFGDVQQLVYLSDIRVYGTRRENPIPLTERSELDPAAEHQFLLDAEAPFRDHIGETASGDGMAIAVLRSAMTAGPTGSSPATDEVLWPAATSNRNRAIPIQLVHQHDLTRAVQFAIERRLHGVYNVASRGVIGSKSVLDMIQQARGSRRKRANRRSRPRNRGVGKYPLIVSDTKFRQAADFEARYSSEQAVRAYCHSYLSEPTSAHDWN